MKKNYNHKQARWLLVVATLLALFVARPVKAEDNVYNGDGYSLKYIAIKNPPEGEEKRAIVIGLTDGTLDYTGHVNIPSKIEICRCATSECMTGCRTGLASLRFRASTFHHRCGQ